MIEEREDNRKLEIIREFKLKREKVLDIAKRAKELSQKPVIEEVLTNGETKLSLESLLEKLISYIALIAEMNIETMKNTLSMYIEHELDKEVQTTQMQERLSQVFSQYGIDANTFRRMFGTDDGSTGNSSSSSGGGTGSF